MPPLTPLKKDPAKKKVSLTKGPAERTRLKNQPGKLPEEQPNKAACQSFSVFAKARLNAR